MYDDITHNLDNSNPCTIMMLIYFIYGINTISVATPLWAKCEDETHTPKSGDLESSRTPATSEVNSRRQNTSP
jgi:hypothetical protein